MKWIFWALPDSIRIAWKSGRKLILKFSPQADFNFVQPWFMLSSCLSYICCSNAVDAVLFVLQAWVSLMLVATWREISWTCPRRAVVQCWSGTLPSARTLRQLVRIQLLVWIATRGFIQCSVRLVISDWVTLMHCIPRYHVTMAARIKWLFTTSNFCIYDIFMFSYGQELCGI